MMENRLEQEMWLGTPFGEGLPSQLFMVFWTLIDVLTGILHYLYMKGVQLCCTKAWGLSCLANFFFLCFFIQLPFQKVQHAITTWDFQEADGGLLIFVVGQLKVNI